jgi:hypothetical protein
MASVEGKYSASGTGVQLGQLRPTMASVQKENIQLMAQDSSMFSLSPRMASVQHGNIQLLE